MKHFSALKPLPSARRRVLLLALLAVGPLGAFAQGVGVGTPTPSANAALDVFSNTKGLMLPRLPHSSAVAQPSAGLLIYDKQQQAPAYHDGTRWNTLAKTTGGSTAGQPDSVTYTITAGSGGSNPFRTGVFSTIIGISVGASNPGRATGGAGSPNYQDISIAKYLDENSIPFLDALPVGRLITSIEFKMFVPGAATPSYSIKISNLIVSSYSTGLGGGGVLVESLTFNATIYGFKNGATGQSTAWNVATNTSALY
jgi:type VI protein secretion system component Hcp